jgi:hypothetical protein
VQAIVLFLQCLKTGRRDVITAAAACDFHTGCAAAWAVFAPGRLPNRFTNSTRQHYPVYMSEGGLIRVEYSDELFRPVGFIIPPKMDLTAPIRGYLYDILIIIGWRCAAGMVFIPESKVHRSPIRTCILVIMRIHLIHLHVS